MKTGIYTLTFCFLLFSAASAQQTLTDVTTINNGSLWVNPPPTGSDAITLYGGGSGPNVLMNPSGIELQSGVLSADPGNSANSLWGSKGLQMIYGHDVSATTNRQDVNGLVGLITTGTSQGLGFYTDLVAGTGTSSNAITSNTPLNYVWHRPVSGNLNEDITLRSIPMMLLGGDHNVLKLVHPTDDTQAIILDPYNGTLTVNGSAVLTQAAADTAYATPSTVASQVASLSSEVATNYVSKSATNLGIGSSVSASGNSSVALGQSTGASGDQSFAAGYWSTAAGNKSIALGSWAYAGKEASVALGGPNIEVKGDYSFGAGSWSTVWQNRSMALGYGLWVTQQDLIVLGRWNDSTRTDLPPNLIFVLGNGTDPATQAGMYTPYTNPNQSNAIEVELSGRTTIRNKNYQSDATAEALNILGSASVSGSLTVAGHPVITQDAADARYLRNPDSGPVVITNGATITGTTQVNGGFTSNGSLTATQSSVFKASLIVQGQRDPSDANPTTTTKIIPQTGQEVLVPEQGDISMGEFRNGSLPLATP